MRQSQEKTRSITKDSLKQVSLFRAGEVIINWRRALNEVLCKSEESVSSERSWARLIKHLRELCPETTWTFICQNAVPMQQEDLKALHAWIEALVASPDWPFPESIVITSEYHGKEHCWKFLFKNSTVKLPFVAPPLSLTVMPYHDLYSSGWYVRAIDSFTINQVGEA